MAKTQGSGLSWMIASAVLGIAFFFTMILAILFFTKISAAEDQAKTASETLDVWVSRTERNAEDMLPLIAEAKDARVSVASKMRETSRKLRETMGVGSNASFEEIKNRLESVGVSQGQNLVDYISQLNAIVAQDKQVIAQLKQDLAKEQENARQATTALQRVTSSFDSSAAKLKGEIDTLGGDFISFKNQTSTSANTLINNVDQERKDALALIGQQKETIAKLQSEAAQLQAQIDKLNNSEARLKGTVDPSLLPDGRISSIISDSRVVYIDLGRSDHIILGMTFEVYDAATGVVKDEQGVERGKATLEVVNVLDNASVCRVVRRESNMELVVGDIVANLVYDPKMKFSFFIFGDFDLDGSGQTTLTDRRRIDGMISAWGGQVVAANPSEPSALSAEVDFLILGQEPPLPYEPQNKTDPVAIENYNKALAKFVTYQNLAAEAKRLSIPVLNQNRFLTMVGYYQR